MAEASGSGSSVLLQAARHLIAENGYTAMTMRQLAGRMGLLPGSLYHHVSCKQDLLLSVLLEIVEQRIAGWEQGSFSNDLKGFIGYLLQRQRAHPDEELLLRHELRHLDPCQRSWLNKSLARFEQPLLHIIQQSHSGTRFAAHDASRVCAAIFAVVEAADSLRQRGIDEAWIETRTHHMCSVLLASPCKALS